MKKILWICCSLLVLGALTAQAAKEKKGTSRKLVPIAEQEAPKVVKDTSCGSRSRPFVVATWPSVPPFGWTEVVKAPYKTEVYEPYGLFYDLFRDVAEHNNKTANFYKTDSIQKAEEAVIAKEADILLGYYYDSNPYAKLQPLYPAVIQNPIVIVTLKGNLPPQKPLENLKGKKGIMRQDENLYTLVHSMLPENMRITQVLSAEAAFQQLLSKQADFIITSRYSAEAELRRFKIKDQVDISDQIKHPSIFFAMAKDNPCLKETQEFFKQYMEPIINDYDGMGDLLRGKIDSWQDRFLYAQPLKAAPDPEAVMLPAAQENPEPSAPDS